MSERSPLRPGDPETIALYLDDDPEPFAVYRPPAHVTLDTTVLEDGEHRLRLRAVDALGVASTRTVPFVVANGPGITLTGLRAGERISGLLELDVNAFSAHEPFDPVRAESQGPVPVWTWVLIAVIAAWAGWYALEYLPTPPQWARTPTFAANPVAAAGLAPAVGTSVASAPAPAAAAGSVAGFSYTDLGARVYAANCAACHGAQGTGVPGVFPPLAGDPVVTASDPVPQIRIVLRGLGGKTIGESNYAARMPAFGARLSDAEIAAVIDHERSSWGNHAPLITPGSVRRER